MTALPPGWSSIDQTAAYFGVSRRTVYRRIASGEWPSSVLPGMSHRRFSPADREAIELLAAPVEVAA